MKKNTKLFLKKDNAFKVLPPIWNIWVFFNRCNKKYYMITFPTREARVGRVHSPMVSPRTFLDEYNQSMNKQILNFLTTKILKNVYYTNKKNPLKRRSRIHRPIPMSVKEVSQLQFCLFLQLQMETVLSCNLICFCLLYNEYTQQTKIFTLWLAATGCLFYIY